MPEMQKVERPDPTSDNLHGGDGAEKANTGAAGRDSSGESGNSGEGIRLPDRESFKNEIDQARQEEGLKSAQEAPAAADRLGTEQPQQNDAPPPNS